MKLLYITAGMPYGPGEVFIIEEIRELLRRRHELLVVPRSPGRMGPHAEDLVPVTVKEPLLSQAVLKCAVAQAPGHLRAICRALRGGARVALKNGSVVSKGLWLARLATERGVDHIHCHWAGTTATMAMLAAEVSGVPWSFTAHRSDIVGNNLLVDKVQSAQFVRVISQDGLQMMFERGVPRHPKIRVLHIGVRLPSFPLRSKITRPPVVLCPADFLPVKGHRYLIEAWKILQSSSVAGELWLAGRGKLDTSAPNVKFLGEVNNTTLLEFYRTGAITATVLASIDLGNGEHEGIPTALMEAMSFAVPVIATNTGGIPELVPPGSGLLVPDKDPVALADAIGAVIRNPVLALQLGRSGRVRVAESFDVTQIVSQLETWFSGTSDHVRECGADSQSAAPRLVSALAQPHSGEKSWLTLVERLLAGAALVVCSPVLVGSALAIILESGFPIFFRQDRAGRHGQIFRLIKLRSMHNTRKGALITAAGDARVTRVGAVLRKYKIDELPQLWNILVGDMHFIGPRPELPPLVDSGDPLWRDVLSARPGITDLATLVYRNEEDLLAECEDPELAYRSEILPRKLALSVQYRRTRNLWSDLKLLALTVRFSFFPRGFEASTVRNTFRATRFDRVTHSMASASAPKAHSRPAKGFLETE